MTVKVTSIPSNIEVTFPKRLNDWTNDSGFNFHFVKYPDGSAVLGAGQNLLYGGKGEPMGTDHKVRQLVALGFEVSAL